MTRVLGLNLGKTRNNKLLKDGGVCILRDGQIEVAIAEERVSRHKYAGGFQQALAYCLDATKTPIDDYEAIVVSSCCEDVCPRELDGINVKDKAGVHFIPSHHLSHAYSAFHVSPFEKALILVIDGGGNVIGTQANPDWWLHRREQNSYYIGEGNRIELIGRDFDGPGEVGLGEAYRCFTYYLGWPSSVYAGKTMALAAYGDPERFSGIDLFDFIDGQLRCRLDNNPFHPIAMLNQFAREHNLSLGEPRVEEGEISQDHKDLAYFIQSQLEEALVAKVRFLHAETGIKNLCIAGGVGLNCIANTRLLQDTPIERLFIQPAAGDQGQALGNALYGYHALLNKPREFIMSNAYWGRSYTNDIQSLDLDSFSGNKLMIIHSDNVAKDAAKLIYQGFIVGWFQGKSELGPRALGNRSILADPCHIKSKYRLDEEVKQREWFMPYAPSVLEEFANVFFDIGKSPFMLLAANVKANAANKIPAVVHEDGTARLQTVSKQENPRYYDLIDAFRELSGIPMVLNTSFNGRGESIVETPEDAIQCFRDHNIDFLVIGDYIISKQRDQ